ncbi:class I SAM-dependent methyltransferase [Piscinibacter sakaiensis]|uniref:class I SAM-dependent methyltransferase n=1 Tax=Piscinibacter sakaiensis TaxID=1547922 RepID=UPI001E527AB3|nr:class I SAM-dependent methyltransferase [Piscinibacter sakaiensis]
MAPPAPPASTAPAARAVALPWPLPALLAWAAAWGLALGLLRLGMAPALALSAGLVLGGVAALAGRTRWRRLLIAGGFPVSLLASGWAPALPAAGWLLPLALLWLLYPQRAWRDAPLFPTPARALDGLARVLPLPDGARVLDAGCGLGAGLRALRGAYPAARLEGHEWSRPLALACRLRCRDARVRRTDLWAEDWSGFALVYLFQRPESMARAHAKAMRELAPGAWLASLEFAVPGVRPDARLDALDGKPVWLYRRPVGTAAVAAPAARPAAGVASMKASVSSSTGASQRSGRA